MSTDAVSFSRSIHAVVVGVSYCLAAGREHSLKDLPECAKGARQIADALTSEKFCRIPSVHVERLYEKANTTRASILAALERAAKRATSHDIIFFYFAGHGLDRADAFYLATAQASREALPGTCVSAEDIVEAIHTTAARGILLVLDCCGGAALVERAPQMLSRLGDRFDFRIFLSASRRGQSSWELEKEGSPFTNLLLRALSGGLPTIGKKGEIYFGKLFEFIQGEMEKLFDGRLKELPRQEPDVAQYFRKEPLVFVNSDVSLATIQLNIDRYSNRDLFKGALLFLGAIATATLLLWTWLDQHQYAEFDRINNVLTFQQGYPHIKALGFPHMLWQLQLKPDDVATGSSLDRRGHIIMARHDDPYTESLKDLTLLGQARVLLQTGSDRVAEKDAVDLLAGEPASRDDHANQARDILVATASPGHADLVENLAISSTSKDVRTIALARIAVIDRELLERILVTPGFEDPMRFDRDIVYPQIREECSSSLQVYTDRAIGNGHIFTETETDMLLRSKCRPPGATVSVDWKDTSRYEMYLRKQSGPPLDKTRLADSFKVFLAEQSATSSDPSRSGFVLSQALDAAAALEFEFATCDSTLTRLVRNRIEDSASDWNNENRYLTYLSRYCRDSSLSLHVSDEGDPEIRDERQVLFQIPAAVVDGIALRTIATWSPAIVQEIALRHVGSDARAVSRTEWVPYVPDSPAGRKLVERLLEDDPLMHGPALIWIFRHAPEKLVPTVRQFKNSLNQNTILEVMELVREDAQLFSEVESVVLEGAAGSVFSVKWHTLWDSADQAIKALSNPDISVRTASLDCLAFRDDLAMIRAAIATQLSPVMEFVLAGIDRAQREHNRLTSDVNSVPMSSRRWRAELAWSETIGGRVLLRRLTGADDLRLR